jgi:hypothetical protein
MDCCTWLSSSWASCSSCMCSWQWSCTEVGLMDGWLSSSGVWRCAHHAVHALLTAVALNGKSIVLLCREGTQFSRPTIH